VTPNSTVNGSPLTQYLGADTGPVAQEARDFTKPTFTATGTQSGDDFSIQLYGTNNPIVYEAWKQSIRGNQSIVVPPSIWVPLDGPADTAGAGNAGNPLTAATPLLRAQGPWLAYRAVLLMAPASSTIQVCLEIAP
jgi:hypothetical protein